MKKDYMSRLRRWARWYLGAEEAVEVISDYEELAAGRSDEALARDLGAPRKAMRQLVDKATFSRWYRGGLFPMGLLSLIPLLYLLFGCFPRTLSGCLIPCAGCLFALWYWGVKPRTPRVPLPKGLLPALLALLLVFLAVSAFLQWLLRIPYTGLEFPAWLIGWHHAVGILCALFVAAGIYGMVLARMYDRRWRALYILAQTAFVAATVLMKPLTSLNLESVIAGEFAPYTAAWAVAAAFGLLGTLWSLLC